MPIVKLEGPRDIVIHQDIGAPEDLKGKDGKTYTVYPDGPSANTMEGDDRLIAIESLEVDGTNVPLEQGFVRLKPDDNATLEYDEMEGV